MNDLRKEVEGILNEFRINEWTLINEINDTNEWMEERVITTANAICTLIEQEKLKAILKYIVRLTVIASDGTSVEEYGKMLSILNKEKRLVQSQLKKEGE